MNAAIVSKYGDLNEVSVREAPVPRREHGEVLVEITAASVNPLDVKLISGNMQGFFPLELPFVVGTDFSGIVAEAEETSSWKAGDRVYGRLEPFPAAGREYGRTGSLAKYVSVPVASLARVPEAVDLSTCAGLPTAAGTAWQALIETAHLCSGQTVLVHGGAGGVGGFAIQFAKQAGARVICTASKANLDYVESLGADVVIDYQTQDFSARVNDVDVVLDTVGGKVQDKSFGVLRRGGDLLSIASPPAEEKAKASGVTAAFVFHKTDMARLDHIVSLFADGKLKVEVAETYPLVEAQAALTRVASGHTRGKLLVSPS